MRTRRKKLEYTIAVRAGVVAALALGVILVGSEPTRALLKTACDAAFEPGSVETGSEAATVFYQLSESIGELEVIDAETASGLVVSEFDTEMSTLSLNTTDAKTGSWALTFHGDGDQTCSGSINVAELVDTRA